MHPFNVTEILTPVDFPVRKKTDSRNPRDSVSRFRVDFYFFLENGRLSMVPCKANKGDCLQGLFSNFDLVIVVTAFFAPLSGLARPLSRITIIFCY